MFSSFSRHSKNIQSIFLTSLVLMLSAGFVACDSAERPKLMKAVKQFDSDEFRDAHIKNMRKNHMDELIHKRDDTVIRGIRTKKHSLKACINCHVPAEYNAKALRHTDPEHFCSTCHNYVAQKIDCFQCHADRPSSAYSSTSVPKDSIHKSVGIKTEIGSPSDKHLAETMATLNNNLNKELENKQNKQDVRNEPQKSPRQSVGDKP